jgi:hypothetical protein
VRQRRIELHVWGALLGKLRVAAMHERRLGRSTHRLRGLSRVLASHA